MTRDIFNLTFLWTE